MPKHMFDTRTQLSHIIWHGDPLLEAFIKRLIEEVKPDRWVETGSHMGWTSMWVAKNFPELPIWTVEVDSGFYGKARDNLEEFGPRVRIAHDSSTNFLYKVLPELKEGLSIFWLDAHWYPPVPLREECKIVSGLDRYVCLVDDFSCWEPDFSGDTFFTLPPPANGDGYLNDISYVSSELGETYWRPTWEQPRGGKGVGMFMKGVEYTPPSEYMKRETLDEFIDAKARSIVRRSKEPEFFVYPLHPSCGRSEP
jgi:hypothetical protein